MGTPRRTGSLILALLLAGLVAGACSRSDGSASKDSSEQSLSTVEPSDRANGSVGTGPDGTGPDNTASDSTASDSTASDADSGRDLASSTSVTVPTRGEALDEVRETRTEDGRARTWRLYVPASLPVGVPAPIVVALHGGMGWADQFIKGSHWLEVAEEGAFILIAPDGVGLGPRRAQTWNGGDGYCCGPAMTQGVDDVGFLESIVEEVASEIEVDRSRVFASGHSNGGIMAYRLACDASSTFVAIGVVAGSLGVEDCDPDRPVSVLHIHGTADENHPFEGGIGPKSVQSNEFNPVMAGVEKWVSLDGCAPDPRVERSGAVETTAWLGCRAGTRIELVLIDKAPHAWPGGSVLAPEVQGEPSQALDATREIWEFFENNGDG